MASNELLHVILRRTASGYYVTSPQAPGLAFGRPTREEIASELPDVLAFHFDDPGPFEVRLHNETQVDTSAGEFVVRVAADEHYTDRLATADHVTSLIQASDGVEFADYTATLVGEVLLVCAVPSDELDWVGAQLDPRDAAHVAVSIDGAGLLTFPVVRAAEGAIGIARDRTIGAALRTMHFAAERTRRPLSA